MNELYNASISLTVTKLTFSITDEGMLRTFTLNNTNTNTNTNDRHNK